MYLKKCDKVAQENVGTDSLKVFSFISHDSLDQLPVVICSRSNANRIRCHTACHCYVPNEADSRNANHLSLFKAFFTHLTWVHHSMAYALRDYFSNSIVFNLA